MRKERRSSICNVFFHVYTHVHVHKGEYLNCAVREGGRSTVSLTVMAPLSLVYTPLSELTAVFSLLETRAGVTYWRGGRGTDRQYRTR